MSRNRAIFELLTAGALWGFGFIATIWALKDFSPSEVIALRYLVAFVAGEIIWFLFFKKSGQTLNPFKCSEKPYASLLAGFFLAGLMIPQTIGLLTTSAAKSAFITTLYILFVPLFAPLFLHYKPKFINVLLALLAMYGTYLLTGANLFEIKVGDLWTLACAVMAAFHILYIDSVSEKITDPFRFNNMQSFFCLICTASLIPFQEKISPLTFNFMSWFGIIFLALASSMIAFTIQIRTQKILEPTTASMLFLVESPFALVFGILLLNESISTSQGLGAIIILLASVGSIIFGKKSST